MKDTKHTMIERQLLARDIRDTRILDAFANVDREDYIHPKYKKYAYVDIEVPINLSDSFMLRPYFLAEIINQIIVTNPKKVLIVGDLSEFTTAILKKINNFECISATEQEFFTRRGNKFDVIYFDSKIYSQSMINKSKILLLDGGRIIYMCFSHYEPFKMRRSNWYDINVLERTYDSAGSKLLSWKIYKKES